MHSNESACIKSGRLGLEQVFNKNMIVNTLVYFGFTYEFRRTEFFKLTFSNKIIQQDEEIFVQEELLVVGKIPHSCGTDDNTLIETEI